MSEPAINSQFSMKGLDIERKAI